MKQQRNQKPKDLFLERMEKLIPDKEDNKKYWEILKTKPVNSIRCNTLKNSPKELIEKLKKYNWQINQPWKDYPEVMIIESPLMPGELGRAMEHLLGYYYVQELSSMLSIIALQPNEKEVLLDICAAPGSKTTQAGAKMKNTGTIIANEPSSGRTRILSSNLERCGVANTIITKKEGRKLSENFKENQIEFDKILLDAPCSGEGTIRSIPKTSLMWNIKVIKSFSHLQKQLFKKVFENLKIGGEIVYSTCTHAPEENEEVINEMLEYFKDKIEIVPIKLPLKSRPGITEWENKTFSKEVKLAHRIYPQDNNTEGFFVSKFRRMK